MTQLAARIFFLFLFLLAGQQTAVSGSDNQTRQTRISGEGLYTVTMESRLNPLKLGRIHAWVAEIKDAKGNPVNDAAIKVGGGMPVHNHGFPTQPRMTQKLGEGKYLIEGIKFSMGGPWVILLEIDANGQSDTVAFDVNL